MENDLPRRKASGQALLTSAGNPPITALEYGARMVTRIGPRKIKPHLYLAQWRMHRGLNQKQLADRMDTTEATISRYENHVRDPTLGFIAAAAEALDVTPAALVGWPPSKEPKLAPSTAAEAAELLTLLLKESA